MKVLALHQRTPEWHQARAGRVTASRIGDAIAAPGTKRRSSYRLQLVLDLEGVEDFSTSEEDLAPWQRDGVTWEAWARGWYSWQPGRSQVDEIGFAVSDTFDWLGCSPDGLIDLDGGIEIKFHKSLGLLRENVDKVPRSTSDQIQLSMFICDRQWWDLVNFWREDSMNLEQGHVKRIHRDDARITYLVERAGHFYAEVLDMVHQRKTS